MEKHNYEEQPLGAFQLLSREEAAGVLIAGLILMLLLEPLL